MRIGTEDKKKLATAGVMGVLALGAAFYLYSELFGGGPAAAPPASGSPNAPGLSSARPLGASGAGGIGSEKRTPLTGAALDPTLKMAAMLVTESLVYSGTGRNIFSMSSAPMLAAVPIPISPARPNGRVVPVASQPQGPAPPPPIDLKFFGTATSGNGRRQAFLLHGEDVFLASDGDIVQRRYRIVSIAANSIVVEDMASNNTQTLPLLTN